VAQSVQSRRLVQKARSDASNRSTPVAAAAKYPSPRILSWKRSNWGNACAGNLAAFQYSKATPDAPTNVNTMAKSRRSTVYERRLARSFLEISTRRSSRTRVQNTVYRILTIINQGYPQPVLPSLIVRVIHALLIDGVYSFAFGSAGLRTPGMIV
jgi:hypothetical protein